MKAIVHLFKRLIPGASTRNRAPEYLPLAGNPRVAALLRKHQREHIAGVRNRRLEPKAGL
jgi:hypothetical protein